MLILWKPLWSVVVFNIHDEHEVEQLLSSPALPPGMFLSDWIGVGESRKFLDEDKAVFDFYIPSRHADLSLISDLGKNQIICQEKLPSLDGGKKVKLPYAIPTKAKEEGLSLDKNCKFSEENFVPQVLCYLGYQKIYWVGTPMFQSGLLGFYEQGYGVKCYEILKFM